MKYLETHADEDTIARRQIENSLVSSISILWNMHVSTFSLKTLYLKIRNHRFSSLTFNEKQSEYIVPLLQEIKSIIEQHSFIQQIDKTIYLTLLDQVMQYYRNDKNIVVVEASSHAKPWFTNNTVSAVMK